MDGCAQRLGVESRRLYDIINILESLSAVSRKAKNLYEWRGLGAINTFVSAIQVFHLYKDSRIKKLKGMESLLVKEPKL